MTSAVLLNTIAGFAYYANLKLHSQHISDGHMNGLEL
jgi:hypothetical protein